EEDIGRVTTIEHRIILKPGARPFRMPLRPLVEAKKAAVKQLLETYKKLGIIVAAEPSNCPYASAIVVVTKKDGTHRMCVDFRPLNEQTVKDSYPLPRISDILTRLARAKHFVALDLNMAYHQIPLAADDQMK